jgi:antitoxin component YwqK of YwqJK toxin-antitoxin module
MSQSNISNNSGVESPNDLLIDAFFNVICNLYKEETKNVLYTNKALYDNVFIKKDKKIKTRKRYFKTKNETDEKTISIKQQYYFLTNLYYTNRIIKHGSCVKYYPNGNIHSITDYVHGKRHGTHLEYSRSGHLLAKLRYDNGRLHGKCIKHVVNGLMCETNFSHGVRHGKCIEYMQDDHEVISECYYIDGKLHGESKEWCQGYLKTHEFYKHGVLHGKSLYYRVYYDADPLDLKESIEYVNGKKHGAHMHYYCGYLSKQENYYEDQLHGVVTTWEFKHEYEDSDAPSKRYVAKQESYKHGVLHGMCRTFYENGLFRTEGNYENGVKVSNV